MKPIISFAITCALVACVSVPAEARATDSTKPTRNACKAFAARWGIKDRRSAELGCINDRRSAELGSSEYERFMIACRAGKIEGSIDQNSERWANCVRRRTGVEANEYRSNGKWLRAMVSRL
jgi:hypothetical protein